MLNDLAALRRTLPAESGDEDVATTLPDGVRAATADVVVTTEPTEDQLTLRISSPGPAPSIAPARVRPWRTALAVVAGGALFAGGIAVGSVWAERRAAELAEKPVDAGSFAATEPVAPTADAGDASSGELAAEDAGPDEGAVDLDADLGYDAASARVIVLATRHAAPGTAHTATPEVAATDLPHAAPPASDAATSRAVFAAPRASASSRPSSVPWPVELPREAGAASGDGTGSTPSPSVPP